MATTGIIRGAYATMVKVSDGSNEKIIPLTEYQANPDGLTITGSISGGYEEIIENSNGELKPLSDHLRDPGGHTVAKAIRTGYESVIENDGTTVSSITAAVAAQEAAAV
ncbi:MAG: hypothetical protein AAFP77_29405 [Bacteroidota bacterium]